jgi:hypothetical protein
MMKGGGMIAGAFEVLSDCEKKFFADTGDRSKGKKFGDCMSRGKREELSGRNRKWREGEKGLGEKGGFATNTSQ